MHRLVIPTILVFTIIVLVSLQCTLTVRWMVWGVHLELLPPLLLYAAFSTRFSTALPLSLFASVVYDAVSAGPMGGSAIPYLAGTALFCAARPIFFRNRVSTRFISGFVLAFATLFLQWIFCGKFSSGLHHVMLHILHLSVFCAILAVFYFAVLDRVCRLAGTEPGRPETSDA